MSRSTSARVLRDGLLLAARSSSGTTVAIVTIVIGFVVTFVFGIVLMAAAVQSSFASTTVSGSSQPSSYARKLIPPQMLSLYMSDSVQTQCPGLSWTIVAAIIHLESNDNRNPGPSSVGARGASQFMPATWDSLSRSIVNVGRYGKIPDGQGYGLDGDGDGLADIMNPYDSVPATARYLCANGAGNPAKVPKAIYAYNHAWWYVNGGVSDSGTYFIGVIPLAAKLAAPATTTSQGWQSPLKPGSYAITSPYGYRFDPYYRRWQLHAGVDLAPKGGGQGATIYAAASGTVAYVGYEANGHGNHVVIDHGGGVQTAYAHMSAYAPGIIPGAPVSGGQVIGYVGSTGASTGPHLHFEVKVNDNYTDPVPWMEAHGVTL